MEIIKLEFKKQDDNKTDLSDQENIDKLLKYVFPIIERNEGWGTGKLTKEVFLDNPHYFQNEIDASVWGNVHILQENGQNLGLLEFSKSSISDRSKERHVLLKDLLNGDELDELTELLSKSFDTNILFALKSFLTDKPIYTSVGLVLRPDLQGKKTGYSEKLYELISDGIVFGWTSNPVIVRQRRKLYKNTLFFPSFEEFPNTTEEWAICLYVYADKLAHKPEEFEGLKFGTMFSPYFVEDRGDEFITIAKKMKKANKITELDEKRIKYVLSKKSCASAVVSWN